MKLFYAPSTCALGIRILLEELGLPYELVTLDLKSQEQNQPAYRAVNPKGKVPALLRDDGSLLTEFQAIALWLAKSYPNAKLLPQDLEGEIRAIELLDYIVASVHMRAITFVLAPQRFVTDPASQKELSDRGLALANQGLEQLAGRLGGKSYFFDDFGLVDAAVYYLLAWEERVGLTIPEKLQAFGERMRARPAVQRALT